jgi:hypothetical protein
LSGRRDFRVIHSPSLALSLPAGELNACLPVGRLVFLAFIYARYVAFLLKINLPSFCRFESLLHSKDNNKQRPL